MQFMDDALDGRGTHVLSYSAKADYYDHYLYNVAPNWFVCRNALVCSNTNCEKHTGTQRLSITKVNSRERPVTIHYVNAPEVHATYHTPSNKRLTWDGTILRGYKHMIHVPKSCKVKISDIPSKPKSYSNNTYSYSSYGSGCTDLVPYETSTDEYSSYGYENSLQLYGQNNNSLLTKGTSIVPYGLLTDK